MNEQELDRQLDESLRAAFVPPSVDVMAAVARDAMHTPRPVRRWPWFVAAAALLVVTLFLVARPQLRGPEGHDGQQLGAMWAAAYDDAVAQGFGGVGCCQMGVDVRKACHERFSCGLDLARDSHVSVLGSYSGLPTGGSMTLLTNASGAPVCVCVVPAKNDPRVELPVASNLHLARRELGDLVLYSLSRSPTTAALDAFVLP
jgi:hypothetical protein